MERDKKRETFAEQCYRANSNVMMICSDGTSTQQHLASHSSVINPLDNETTATTKSGKQMINLQHQQLSRSGENCQDARSSRLFHDESNQENASPSRGATPNKASKYDYATNTTRSNLTFRDEPASGMCDCNMRSAFSRGSSNGSLCSGCSLGCKSAPEMLLTLSKPPKRICPWCKCKKSHSINMDALAAGGDTNSDVNGAYRCCTCCCGSNQPRKWINKCNF